VVEKRFHFHGNSECCSVPVACVKGFYVNNRTASDFPFTQLDSAARVGTSVQPAFGIAVRLRAKFAVLGTPDENLGALLTPRCGQPESIQKCGHFPSILFAILFIILSCMLSAGKTPPQPNTSTFHASTELVSVPVVVKDRYKNRVHGLTKNDFRVLENGHEVEIRSFESMANPGLPTMAPDPAKVQTALSRAVGAVPIILFFDQLNTPANEQSEVRRRACSLVSEPANPSRRRRAWFCTPVRCSESCSNPLTPTGVVSALPATQEFRR